MTQAALEKLAEKASPTMRANIAAALQGPPPPAAPPAKASIRMPKEGRNDPNKTEARFLAHFGRLWRPSLVLYEAVTLRLPSGTRYTPDWLFEFPDGLRLHIEVKGPHIHNSASIRAFKEAVSAFNFERWKFLFAQYKAGQWCLEGFQPHPQP